MENQNILWKQLTQTYNPKLNDALQHQHQAAQFIALIGKHLVPQQSDDSNTNMEFVFDKNILVGNPFPGGFRVGLNLIDLKLIILNHESLSINEISLDGKNKQEVFDELKTALSNAGVDTSKFSLELHYEIPEHPIDKGAAFSLKNRATFVENTKYRHNAEIIIQEIIENIADAEAVRIWPHHFDTGSFVALSKSKEGQLMQSIGLGFAIPDAMIDEPYFYLSFWSEKPIERTKNMETLQNGKWMMPDWNGGVLRLSDILTQTSAQKQHEFVRSFFKQGIDFLLKHLKSN